MFIVIIITIVYDILMSMLLFSLDALNDFFDDFLLIRMAHGWISFFIC